MKEVVTIRLDAELQRELDEVCGQLGRTRSEVVRDALRRQLSLMRFEAYQAAASTVCRGSRISNG